MEHNLEVDTASWIEDKCAIIARVVVRSETRRAIASSTYLESSSVELANFLRVVGRECNVLCLQTSFETFGFIAFKIHGVKPEVWFRLTHSYNGWNRAEDFFETQMCQGGCEEGDYLIKLALRDSESEMINRHDELIDSLYFWMLKQLKD